MIGIPAYANMVRRGRSAFAVLCLAGLAACAAADGGEPVETLILPAPQQVSVGGKTYLVEMLAVPSVFMPTTNPAKDEQPREVVDYDLAVSHGFDPLPIGEDIIRQFQMADGRCAVTINIIDEQTANWSRDEAQDLMTNWLSTGEPFDGVIANNDEMAIGAIQAMKVLEFGPGHMR